MIKYILHGGGDKISNPSNNEYYKEMTKGLAGEIKILLNFFSREPNEIPERAELRRQLISENSENKNLHFELADESNFLEQLKRTNIMYICGGDSSKLTNTMKKFPKFVKLLDGKVIAGSSAGTYFLTKYFYENDESCIEEGLGVLNIKAFCHYDESKKAKELGELGKYKEKLPIIILPEHKWVIVRQ